MPLPTRDSGSGLARSSTRPRRPAALLPGVLALALLPFTLAASPPEPAALPSLDEPRLQDEGDREPVAASNQDEDEGSDETEASSDQRTQDERERRPNKKRDIVKLAEPKWIKHEIIPGERLDEIADRYRVRTGSLIRWNKLDKNRPRIIAGRTLAIYTKHIPPPRQKIIYTVEFGDTWNAIAEAHRVDADLLRRRWNSKVPRRFKAGQKIVIWVDPLDDPKFGAKLSAAASTLPLIAIPGNSISVGKPNKGRLLHSVQLPENKQLYTLRKPEEAYGSSHTLDHLQLAIARWRQTTGFRGALKIGSISKRGGGKLRPHSSHRSGRDVDIRLPVKQKGGEASKIRDVDWDALWGLIVALVDTGEVQSIYLTTGRQKHLYAAAKRAGASPKTLAQRRDRAPLQGPHGAHPRALQVRPRRGSLRKLLIARRPSSGRSRPAPCPGAAQSLSSPRCALSIQPRASFSITWIALFLKGRIMKGTSSSRASLSRLTVIAPSRRLPRTVNPSSTRVSLTQRAL